MRTLTVDLAERSYPIYIGSGLLEKPELIAPYVRGKDLAIVTNDTIAPLYLQKMRTVLDSRKLVEVVLPDGEQYKNLSVLNGIFDKLLESHCDRQTVIVALGGGVVGDMAGFAAACYQRGVPFIQVPTTLLAQVDSSVGGKTGVNHPLGKNMIGAFYQPRAVVIDTDTLYTLSDRELRAGLAEVIKYGLIRDVYFFDWLETNIEKLLQRDSDALTYAIETSCRNKAEVVAADERESGVRALLNFGHTFGHAIETGLGYGQWLHGEGVAAGMVAAADLSRRLGWLTDTDFLRIQSLISAAGLPVKLPHELTEGQMRTLVSVDKKVADGMLRLVLLTAIGKASISTDFSEELLTQTLVSCRHEGK